MNMLQRLSKKGDKITFYYDYGRGHYRNPVLGAKMDKLRFVHFYFGEYPRPARISA